MSVRNLQWTKGAPERLESGMVLLVHDGDYEGTWLVGSDTESDQSWAIGCCVAWAWLIKPHTLEWIADMAKAHGVGK